MSVERDDSALSAAELLRYERQLILPEIGGRGQQKLKNSTVVVVGAGGLGSPVLTYLAASGVGNIVVVDSDRVEQTNLHRQPLFTEADVGEDKVQVAKKRLLSSNSLISVVAHPKRLSVENARELVAGADVVVDGSDNFATKYLLNDLCAETKLPLVSGSIFRFEGQVSVYNAVLSDGRMGPTYRCLFPEPPDSGLVPACAQVGVLGVLPAIVGSIQCAEVLKILLGVGDLLAGQLLLVDVLGMTFRKLAVDRTSRGASLSYLREGLVYDSYSVAKC